MPVHFVNIGKSRNVKISVDIRTKGIKKMKMKLRLKRNENKIFTMIEAFGLKVNPRGPLIGKVEIPFKRLMIEVNKLNCVMDRSFVMTMQIGSTF